MLYFTEKRRERECISLSPRSLGGTVHAHLAHPVNVCSAPLCTHSPGCCCWPFFFGGGVAFGVIFNFFLLEDQDRPKIHDQNVFALDFALEEAEILAAKPSGTKWRSGGVTLFDL